MLPKSAMELTPGSSILTVVAGEFVEQDFGLTNLTLPPSTFYFLFEGFPANWGSFSSDRVSLFTGQRDVTTFRLQIPSKTRPDQYSGYVVATPEGQSNLRVRSELKIVVLPALKLEAWLRPHHATGFRADFALLLRNNNNCDCRVEFELVQPTYCATRFYPPQVEVKHGQQNAAQLKVRLRGDTPRDFRQQPQNFIILLHQHWNINNTFRTTTASVTGEYLYKPLLEYFKPQRILLLRLLLIILIVIACAFTAHVWFIRAIDTNTIFMTKPDTIIWIDQNTVTEKFQSQNPIPGFVPTQLQLRFRENDQKVQFNFKVGQNNFATIEGKLMVEENTGNLLFKTDQNTQTGFFPWWLFSPEETVQRINLKLKNWLINNGQRMFDTRIEGNTVFVRVRPCATNDPACVRP